MSFKPTDRVAELGGGSQPLFHPNIDACTGEGVDIVADLNEGIPLENESYDGIYASFVMEHLRLPRLRGFLAELERVLKPEGIALIITSNLYDQAKVIIEKENRGEVNDDVIHMVFGGKPDIPENYHHSSLTPKYLVSLLREAGFDEITIYEHPAAKAIWNHSTDMIVQAKKGYLKIERKL
jgi:ubiquinone/menaquinone biosynthesis C-methylase UbiE